MEQQVIDILRECGALLEGHFILSSGRHSNRYCQCAQLLKFPHKAAAVLQNVAEQVKDFGITKVCGPAMGGVIVSYELGRQLDVESIFTERKDGEMQLRRGFNVGKGDKVLIAEDVVTTGKSTMETVAVLRSMGAEIVGVACIVDRRGEVCALDIPLYSAVKLDIQTFEAENCPLCKQGIPTNKPGSRA